MSEVVYITTPEGRIVWGDPHRRNPIVDDATKQQKIDQSTGKPRFDVTFGLAIPKDQFAPVWDAMSRAAALLYPQGVPNGFAWKYKDGDTDVDGKGNPLRNKEGYAGCYILTISTETVPKVLTPQNGAWVQIESGVKTGDFVQVGLGIKPHAGMKPGLYVNPIMVGLSRIGDAINSGPSAEDVFGAAPASVGSAQTAQAMPGMPGQAPMPQQMPGQAPMPQQMPGQAPMPQQMPGNAPMPGTAAPTQNAPGGMPMPGVAGAPAAPTASPTNIQPAHDFVNNAAGMPGQAPMPGMPGQQ